MGVNLKRTALNITTYCNLKCKHCLAFIPYYKERMMMGHEKAKKILEMYWKIVDSVDNFTVTGGEPLLNMDCMAILEEVYEYKDRVNKSIDFVTNGTIIIPENIINLFEMNKDKTKVIVSDYGPDRSTCIKKIIDVLKEKDICYRISKFYGNDLYYDGWIDFTDHSLKWKDVYERDTNAQKCVHRVGKYFVINDEEIHCCSRSYWRMKNGIIPKTLGEYVPLTDESISIKEKQDLLLKMYNMKSSTSCAHCVGLCNDAVRVEPAQQL